MATVNSNTATEKNGFPHVSLSDVWVEKEENKSVGGDSKEATADVAKTATEPNPEKSDKDSPKDTDAPVQDNWEKRYKDLQAFKDKQVNEMRTKLTEAEAKSRSLEKEYALLNEKLKELRKAEPDIELTDDERDELITDPKGAAKKLVQKTEAERQKLQEKISVNEEERKKIQEEVKKEQEEALRSVEEQESQQAEAERLAAIDKAYAESMPELLKNEEYPDADAVLGRMIQVLSPLEIDAIFKIEKPGDMPKVTPATLKKAYDAVIDREVSLKGGSRIPPKEKKDAIPNIGQRGGQIAPTKPTLTDAESGWMSGYRPRGQ